MLKKKNENHILIAETIKEHQEDFYRLAYRYVKDKDEALDIVQESVYKALTSVKELKNPDFLKSWLYRIVINTSISHIRKHQRVLVTQEVPESYIDESNAINTSIDLHKAIDELSEAHKTVILLRYFEDLKIEEIAEVMNTNINTVKSRLYTAVKCLRNNVEGEIQ